MQLLIDNSPAMIAEKSFKYKFIGGQLLTPLTRYADAGMKYGIDNGCFKEFNADGYISLLSRQRENRDRCLFVCAPDVVGNAKMTSYCFWHWWLKIKDWPLAFVIQDGAENEPIPWSQISAVFIGGSTDYKMSKSAVDIIRAAQIMDKHVHVGRINTVARWRHFANLGVDTCDGSGVSRFDWMLDKIQAGDIDNQESIEFPEDDEHATERDDI